ncbi:hypothetical protein BKA69DRAFT_795232 [Paraphysoderma sedebokerense]|nr:hypothetical protein BKA69DRAFT_795232 [Paraphysoderma sedebokerense]
MDRCIPCQQNLAVNILLIGVLLLLVCVAGYYMINHGKNRSSFAIVSILLNFFQTIAITREVELKWPEELKTIMDRLSFALLNVELLAPECFLAEGSFNYSTKLKIVLTVPFVLLIVVSFGIALLKVYSVIRKSKVQVATLMRNRRTVESNSSMPSVHRTGTLSKLVRTFNGFLPLLYMTLASYSLAMFDCTQEADGVYYLDTDISLRCWDERWYGDYGLALAAIAIYVFGIPLYFLLIYASAHQNREGAFWNSLRESAKSLIDHDKTFKQDYQFLLFFQLIQKLALVAVNLFFTRYIAIQLIGSSTILLLNFQIHLKYRPYTYHPLNILELLSNLSSVAVLFLGLLFYAEQFKNPQQRIVTMVLILVVIFGFTLIACVCLFYEIFRDISIRRCLKRPFFVNGRKAVHKVNTGDNQDTSRINFATVNSTAILSPGSC